MKWHDGAPFNADDVLYSFNTYANPMVASTWATKVQDIAGYDDVTDECREITARNTLSPLQREAAVGGKGMKRETATVAE